MIAVPIPREHSASGNLIESAIQRAIQEARLLFSSLYLSHCLLGRPTVFLDASYLTDIPAKDVKETQKKLIFF